MLSNSNVRERRKNGFSPPYTAAQISTWVALPLLFLEFLFFVSPILPLIASVICTVVYSISVGLSVYYAVKASSTDPMDKYLAKRLNKHKGKKDGDNNEDGDEEENGGGFANALGDGTEEGSPEALKHCWICDTQVAEHSMHCKFCNKCIGHFDHHCMWLNTCVGKANYDFFLRTMVYITVMLLIHCCTQVALIVDIFLDEDSERSRLRSKEWFDLRSYIAVVSVLIGFVVFDVIALSLIGQLLYFHMGLRREGLTTYKYIVRENQRKRERTQQKTRRHNQRIVAMSKARDDGRYFYAKQIRYGGMISDCTGCKLCDPLPPDPLASPPLPSSNNSPLTLVSSNMSQQQNGIQNSAGDANGNANANDTSNGNDSKSSLLHLQ